MISNDSLHRGVFFAVSTGPGKPELLTVEALDVLLRCPVIAYPQTGGGTHAFDTVRRAIDVGGKILVPVRFQMSHQSLSPYDSYGELVGTCSSYLDAGKDVAFVSVGDVSLYSSAGTLLQLLKTKGYEVRAVAGVNAFSAAACACALDVADADSPVSIIPGDASYKSGKIDAMLAQPGTKIFMKMNRHLKECVESVVRAGLIESAVLVQRCSLPGERILSGKALLALPEEILAASYLSVLIVRGQEG